MPAAVQARDPGAVLHGAGIRSTPQRLEVLKTLASVQNDATAQELHSKLRRRGSRIGLATVYRALAALSDHGIIDTLTHRQGEASYRLCGEGHHHHLTCTACHRVVELEGCSLDTWLAEVSRQESFALTSHRVELAGLCADCQ